MKVLVTGGAGYVGCALVPMLLEKGYDVKVLDNLMFGGDQLLPFFREPKFEFIKGDVRNPWDIKQAVQGCDAIIHLAAIVGYPACRQDPELAEAVNLDGTNNLALALSKDQTIMFASTGSNYGAVEDICTEDTPLHPLSLYGQTKTKAEKILLDNCSAIVYRFATAFGVSPRLRLDLLINDFTFKALSQEYLVVYERHFMRTFIHVHDMARAFCFGLENPDKMTGQVYNVGSEDMNLSKERICECIKQYVKCYVHYADVGEDADKRNYVVSYKKLNDLGYTTSIDIDTGIRELVRALKVVSFKTPYSNV